MSLNHLLNSSELDIIVKSAKVGTYNATPYNQVKTNQAEVIMYYNDPLGPATQDFADYVRYHISRNGDFIDVTGSVGWDFAPNTLGTNQGPHIDIIITHPEVESDYIDFTTRECASSVDIKGIDGIQFRLLDGIPNNLPTVVAGTNFSTTIRQNFNVSSFTGANKVLYSFKYSILCKTK